MRTRLFLLAASVTSLAAAAITQGCGDTSDTTPASTDAGNDVTQAPKKDATPPADADDDAATCDTSADLTKDIPDADMADGASTTGICMGCAKANCDQYIKQCEKNCECQTVVGKALDCYTKNTDNPFKCAGGIIGASDETQQIGKDLLFCVQGSCQKECPTPDFGDGGAEGGDGGDGG